MWIIKKRKRWYIRIYLKNIKQPFYNEKMLQRININYWKLIWIIYKSIWTFHFKKIIFIIRIIIINKRNIKWTNSIEIITTENLFRIKYSRSLKIKNQWNIWKN